MQQLASSFLGLGNGGTFAALALALVLTYRASGVINFATGAQALFGAYMYAFLRQGELLLVIPGLPDSVDLGGRLKTAPALALALLISALLGAFLHVAVFRPLRDAPPLARAVASLGVLVVLQTLLANRLGTAPVSVQAIYPSDRWEWRDMAVLSDRFYLALTILVLATVITVLYRWSRFGLLTRATAESQVGAYVSGISPDRVALLNWMISGAVAGFAGILIAPLAPVTPASYTLFVVPALAAAIVGGFQHLMPTVIAGISIGMVQAWLVFLAGRHEWMPQSGVGETVPLVVMLVALLVTGRAVPARGALIRTPLGRAPRPRSLLTATAFGVVVGSAALLLTESAARASVITTMILAIITLSLVVVTGYAGQVSLAQLALAGVGAFTLSGITDRWGVPFPIGPILAALVATAIGVLVGLPALRLRGLTLGVVTLALAYGIEAVWFRNSEFIGSSGAQVEQPSFLGIDLGIGIGAAFPRLAFGFMVLTVFALVALGVAALRVSSLGSAMLAVRANERSAAGIGINVVYVKVMSFAIASFIAGLGGSLLAYRRGTVTWESFTALGSLTLLSTAYLAGVTSVSGGVQAGILAAGGIVFYLAEQWIDLGDWFPVISGVAVILTLMQNPEGLASAGHRFADWVHARRHGTGTADGHRSSAGFVRGERPAPARVPPPLDAPAVLAVRDLTVVYGGVVAVSGVSLSVPAGAIVGLIGPNGAGKTSVIDAITGFTRADGDVRLGGDAIDALPAHQRVRRGLARTFQSLELYDDLSVEENVSAAAFAARDESASEALDRALELVGISELRGREAGSLSQGERQLLSIARACATGPDVLLLDEPAAGLDTTETKWLGERIQAISATGTGVLLVDHDVALVLGVCDYLYVLDFGEVIAEGDPASIRTDRRVADAYLGQTHDAGSVAG